MTLKNNLVQSIMERFNFFNKTTEKVKSNDDSVLLINCAIGGVIELENEYKKLTDAGKFEVILYNSNFVLNIYRENFPEKYSKVEEDYFNCINNQAKQYKLPIKNRKLHNFINSRLRLYFDEFEKLRHSKYYTPGIEFSAFYKTPLATTLTHSTDLLELMEFNLALSLMTKNIHDNTYKIFSEVENFTQREHINTLNLENGQFILQAGIIKDEIFNTFPEFKDNPELITGIYFEMLSYFNNDELFKKDLEEFLNSKNFEEIVLILYYEAFEDSIKNDSKYKIDFKYKEQQRILLEWIRNELHEIGIIVDHAKIKGFDIIFSTAEEGMQYYENKYNSKNISAVFEFFLFSFVVGLRHSLLNGSIDIMDSIAKQTLIYRLCEYSRKFGFDFEFFEMSEFYMTRYNIFLRDIDGLNNSNYPDTKRYLPEATYQIISHNGLLKNLIDVLSAYRDDENEEYLSKLVEFTDIILEMNNWTINKLDSKSTA